MSQIVEQLPRGRHGLSRATVLASQRGRLFSAIVEAVVQNGFAQTSVADVIRRAKVSRETFYEQFDNKEDCFVSALDAAAGAMLELLGAAAAQPAGSVRVRMDRVLAAYLDLLARQPAFARVFLIDAYGAGTRATERRIALQSRFVELVIEVLEARTATDRFACEAIVAAVSSLVTVRVGRGEAQDLAQLRVPLLELAGRLVAHEEETTL